jgi:hypothetical protein
VPSCRQFSLNLEASPFGGVSQLKLKNLEIGYFMNSKMLKIGISSGLLAGVLAPSAVHACACGCGIFDVGGPTMLPSGPGGMVWGEFDYQNQNRDWNGASKGDPDNNGDKRIQTEFTMVGMQYMFNTVWGLEAEAPYDFRYFKGTDGNGNIATHSWSELGDIRVNAIYTGFSDDLSTGLTLGLKLPTGRFDEDSFLVDRDTQLGTGSTDVLLGAFHRGKIGHGTGFEWFVQGLLDVPVASQGQYIPGTEFDSDIGIDYTGFSVGNVRIVPLAQVLFSAREHDSGNNADELDTGYERVLLSPGVEFDVSKFRIYADAEVPVYQYFRGNQLAAPVLLKCSFTYMF